MASDGVEQAESELDWSIAPEKALTTTTVVKPETNPVETHHAEAPAPADAPLATPVVTARPAALAFPTLSERVAALRGPDDMATLRKIVARSSRFNGETPAPLPVCTALTGVRVTGYQYLVVSAAQPDVESLRTAIVDMVNAMETLMPLVPQELPTHVGDMATLGASLLTDIQSATTTEQLSALLTPYVDAHSPMMLQVFANQAVECPDFAD